MHRYSYQKINAGNRISYFIQFITKPTKRKKRQWFNILQTDRVSAAADVAEIPQIISPESSRYASAHNHLTSQHVLSLHDIGVHVSIIGRYWCCKIVTMLFVQLLFHILKSSPVPFSALTLWHQTYKKLSLILEVCLEKPVKEENSENKLAISGSSGKLPLKRLWWWWTDWWCAWWCTVGGTVL